MKSTASYHLETLPLERLLQRQSAITRAIYTLSVLGWIVWDHASASFEKDNFVPDSKVS